MKDKQKGALADIAIYAAAFGIGLIPFMCIEDIFAATAAFTAAATFVVFIASCALSDVSAYDPYWSVAPVVMILADMIKYRLWNVNAFIVLGVVCVWSVRLTANWYYTYKGIGHEDWRYAQYREKRSAPVFLLISFFGLHSIPTAVVYGGLVSGIFAIRAEEFSPVSLFGVALMLAAVTLEYISDRSIHRFLRENAGVQKTCGVSVWKYSRHPNYLGEISFWLGLYLYFVPLYPEKWYICFAALSVPALFLTVSIPMMEKHNAERRSDYAEYREKTSALLLLPNKK